MTYSADIPHNMKVLFGNYRKLLANCYFNQQGTTTSHVSQCYQNFTDKGHDLDLLNYEMPYAKLLHPTTISPLPRPSKR